jgi:hypothetical protein
MRAIITSVRTTELRKGNRYRLNAPALFLWAPQNGPPQSGKGVTRDIGASGVCVLANRVPPVGSRVQMDILLPKLKDSGPGMHLNGEGIVVRVEPRGRAGEGGFAAEVQFYPEASEMFLSHLNCSGWVV